MRLAAWLTLWIAAAGAAHAGGNQVTLAMRAVVLSRASVGVFRPASIQVTSADVERGYVEVPAQVVVRGNMSQGYSLVFERPGDRFAEVAVLGLGQPLLPGTVGISAARPAPGPGLWRDALALRVRIRLAATSQPGQYPWPLQISLLPS